MHSFPVPPQCPQALYVMLCVCGSLLLHSAAATLLYQVGALCCATWGSWVLLSYPAAEPLCPDTRGGFRKQKLEKGGKALRLVVAATGMVGGVVL